MNEVLVRRAAPCEAPVLTGIARRSKRYWGYPRRWLRLWRGDLTVTPAYVERVPVYCAVRPVRAVRGRSIAGFCAVADRGADVWEIEHLWVLPGEIGQGIGTLLFRRAAAEAERAGARCLRVVSDPHAEGFYRRMGARLAGTVPSRPAGRTLPVFLVPFGAGGTLKAEVRIAGDLRPGDFGRVVELHGVLYATEWGFDSTFEAYVAEPLARFVLTRTPRERLWLVEERDALRGCLAIVRVSDEVAQLRWFLLHPALRGQGLGRRLLGEAVAFCRESGYRKVMLWTVGQLQAAGHLYAAAGFQITAQKQARMWGQAVTEQQYVLELG